MNSIKLCIYILIAHLITFFLAEAYVFAAMPPKYRYRQLKGDLQINHFSTKANFDTRGTKVSLQPDHKYNFLSVKPKFLYAISSDMAVEGGFIYGSASSEDGVDKRSNGEITDIEASIYYKAIKSNYYLLPHIKLSFPLVKFEETSDDVFINEGVLQLQVGAWLEKIILGHRFYSYFGYLYQGDNRAHLLPYELGMYNSISRFIYGLSINGNMIASDDKLLKTPLIRTDVTNTLNGGSLKFYSVNPEALNARALIGLRVTNNSIIYLKYQQSLSGKNTADGQTAILQYKIRLFSPSKKRRRSQPRFRPDGLDDKDIKALDKMGT